MGNFTFAKTSRVAGATVSIGGGRSGQELSGGIDVCGVTIQYAEGPTDARLVRIEGLEVTLPYGGVVEGFPLSSGQRLDVRGDTIYVNGSPVVSFDRDGTVELHGAPGGVVTIGGGDLPATFTPAKRPDPNTAPSTAASRVPARPTAPSRVAQNLTGVVANGSTNQNIIELTVPTPDKPVIVCLDNPKNRPVEYEVRDDVLCIRVETSWSRADGPVTSELKFPLDKPLPNSISVEDLLLTP